MNKPVFSRPPLLIGIGGTTRPGSSTERALAAALEGKKKYHNFQELLMTNDTWEVK